MKARLHTLTFLTFAVLAAACGGSDSIKAPPLGQTCVLNSECQNPLSCSFGRCHPPCKESRDCQGTNVVCVKVSSEVSVCQGPMEHVCHYKSECPTPLVCARDLQCRNECQADVDCNKGQTCLATEKVCADPSDVTNGMLKNAIDGSVPATPPDAGAGGDAPVTGGGGDGSTAAKDAPAGGSDGGTTTPGNDGPLPTTPIPVDSVTVDKPVVRQGEQGILATVTAPSGLSNPTNIEAGDCRGTAQAGGTDTMFMIRISCGHGVMLGMKDLRFQTARGVGTKAGIIEVTAITAAPSGKDDNRGTKTEPYRTFKKALSVADVGDTIQLMDGTYDKEAGEDFKDPIPSKITILGQSAAGTKLVGPTDAAITADGIKLREAGELTIKNISFGFFRYGIYLDKMANLTLENVKLTRSRQQGIYIYTGGEGSKITWTGDESEITDHGAQAIYVGVKGIVFNFKSKGTISSAMNAAVIQLQGDTADLTIEGATLKNAQPLGQALTLYNGTNYSFNVTLTNVNIEGQVDIGGKDKTTATLTNTTFTLPTGYSGQALDFYGAKLTISKCNFVGGANHLKINSGEVTVRETKFKDYYYNGVNVTTAKKVDLGTAASPGANAFTPGTVNANSYAIYDSRPADPMSIS
jgi:hypothetical protein